MDFAHRLATRADIPALTALMDRAIGRLQQGFLTEAQIKASRAIMGLDTQLIDDGGYFIVEHEKDGSSAIAGSGGWSRRATTYGGDHSPGRDASLLDPATEPARVRAMYTDPAFVRRGVGRLILSLCEAAAAREGFGEVQLVATRSGEPLYRSCGYRVIEAFEDPRGGAPVPLARMGKALTTADPAAAESTVPGAAPGKPLSPAARRALEEAAARRAATHSDHPTSEAGGPKGLEPTRFGDWERKGLAVDF